MRFVTRFVISFIHKSDYLQTVFVVILEDDNRSSLQSQEILFKFRWTRPAFFLLIDFIVRILLLQNVEVSDPGLSVELDDMAIEASPVVK